jgi:hypothetical protein
MSRSGFLLSVTGPAAILTLLIHPTIRQAADQWAPVAKPAISLAQQDIPDVRVLPATVGHVHLASVPSAAPRSEPVTPALGRTASDKDMPRMRKPLQEGCERAISSLAGPEARRMVPGRCMT